MESILNSNSSYVVVTRKNFNRRILVYEVLPLSVCYSVDNVRVLSANMVTGLLACGAVNEKDIVLEFTLQEENGGHISLTDLVKVWFISKDAMEQLLERSYDNYDVSTLSCGVLPVAEQSVDTPYPTVLPPESASKDQFAAYMTYVDGVLALLHQRIQESGGQDLIPQLEMALNSGKEELLTFALGLGEMDQEQCRLAQTFLELCINNDIDAGWTPADVVETFERTAPKEVACTEDFKLWVSTVKKLLRNKSVPFLFTDEKNIVLRAMTLVLLNPETEQLKAVRAPQKVGSHVYRLACSFALARVGYSYLSDTDRALIGDMRKVLQKINAYLHNRMDNPDLRITLAQRPEQLPEKLVPDTANDSEKRFDDGICQVSLFSEPSARYEGNDPGTVQQKRCTPSESLKITDSEVLSGEQCSTDLYEPLPQTQTTPAVQREERQQEILACIKQFEVWESRWWRRVEKLLEQRGSSGVYEELCERINELHELHAVDNRGDVFNERLKGLQAKYSKKQKHWEAIDRRVQLYP